MNISRVLFSFILSFIFTAQTFADEGMYTFDNPPIDTLKTKYGFTPSKEWFDHAMAASVRFNNGGSGSFVSSQGLVMTNHHVGFDCIQKKSLAYGLYA